MRRRAVIGFGAVLAVGVVAVLVLGFTRGSSLVYSIGVEPAAPSVRIDPGKTACQGPISVPDGEAFDRVTFTVGTYFKPGPELRVEVRDATSVLGAGTLPAGYPDVAQAPQHVVQVGRVAPRAPLAVCLRNVGDRPVAAYGQNGGSQRTVARLDGQPLKYDMAVTLNREERSLVSLLPTIAERASLFRAGWVGPATFLVLGLLVLIAVPALLLRGVARAAAEDA
jgi:hypothetical protein